jgi:hypothetical protein
VRTPRHAEKWGRTPKQATAYVETEKELSETLVENENRHTGSNKGCKDGKR